MLLVAGGIGCGLGLLLIGFIGAIFLIVLGSLKSSDAYETSLQYFRSNPTVVSDLGTPIDDGLLPGGSINTSGASGHADLTFSLSGPKGEGSAHVIADRSAAGWSIRVAEWTYGGSAKQLLAPAPSPALPAP